MKLDKKIKLGRNKGIGFGFHIARYKDKIRPMIEYKSDEDYSGKLLKYIHIGYPKAASTALQNGFFGKHPQLLHLGCGARGHSDYWDDLGYIDKNINIAMEIDLRYRNSLSYDAEKVNAHFQKYFTQAKNSKDIKACGISNENYSFQWNYGIDIEEKARRLHEIFGSDTKIIIITREQKDLLKSLYKEQIRFGYAGSYNDFLQYLWNYKDRSFFYEFCFDKVVSVYERYFGKENIHIFTFEDFKTKQTEFLSSLSDFLTIKSDLIPEITTHYNKQLSNEALAVKRIMNEKYPHTSEKGFYNPFDNHRYIPYYTDELKTEVPFDVFFDYHLRHKLCMAAESIAEKTEVKSLDLSYDKKFDAVFKEHFGESNKNLSEKYNLNLSEHNYLL
jgi:hypothetical protein